MYHGEFTMSIQHASLRQLRVFEAAATSRSFSKAALALHLTQPGVSMHIKELETNAGLPLFERIGHDLRPWCGVRCQCSGDDAL